MRIGTFISDTGGARTEVGELRDAARWAESAGFTTAWVPHLPWGLDAMVALTVAGQVTSRIEKIAGISQLSVDPVLGGNQQDPGARVTIQQRVTGNLFVTFATDATSTQREVIKLEYQATPRVSVSGVRDQNGGFAFDVRIRKTW